MSSYEDWEEESLLYWERLADLLGSDTPMPASSVPGWTKVKDDLERVLELE